MDEELPGFQDIVAHLRTRGAQVDPRSGSWRFRVRAPDGHERLIMVEHELEPEGDGWIFVRVARDDRLVDRVPQDPERELDLGGLVVFVKADAYECAIPFETIETLADFDRALDRILAAEPAS